MLSSLGENRQDGYISLTLHVNQEFAPESVRCSPAVIHCQEIASKTAQHLKLAQTSKKKTQHFSLYYLKREKHQG